MKILLFDTETAPSMAYIWRLYSEITSMEMVESDWYMLCWSAKWLNQKGIISSALPDHKLYLKEKNNDFEVVKKLWILLDEADIVIAHNAIRFDIKKVNTRFIIHGLTPPSPYKIIDTLKVAQSTFGFMSNRLDDLGKFLKVGEKVNTGGFRLWKGCLEGNETSWNKMVKYCKRDVTLLEKVYLKMRPYIYNHPNLSMYVEDSMKCPKCGSFNVVKEGTKRLLTGIIQQYSCKDCGGWSHQKIYNNNKEEKGNILKNG